MELTVDPADLLAASLALRRCRSALDDALLAFAARARHDVPELGVRAAAAGVRSVGATQQAVEVISDDISRLALALSRLADHYPRVDATALPAR
jgi:hypothetical protein